MDLGLAGKVIIVTGGAKGIGYGISQVLATEGAVVAIVSRGKESVNNAVDFIESKGGKAFGFIAELTEPKQCKNAVEDVVTQLGRIDGVVNNAGINDGVGLENGNYEDFVRSIHRNLIHYYLIVHHALDQLKKYKGAIVNIGSKTSVTGQGGTSAYAAANGGRNALTREWAVELLPHSIRVNEVIVAECYTPLYQRWIKTFNNPKEKLESITRNIPLQRRMTTAQEIANTVAFLLSEKSSHTTGQILFVDGGYTHLDRSL